MARLDGQISGITLIFVFILLGLGGCRFDPDASKHSVVSKTPIVSPSSTPALQNDISTKKASPAIQPTSLSSQDTNVLVPTLTIQESATDESEPTMVNSITKARYCGLGFGLNINTAFIVEKYGDTNGMVMTGSVELSQTLFPELEGWIRVMGAPSLDSMERKAFRSIEGRVPYEALSYGLETGSGTPDDERSDLIGSTKAAREIAAEYGKLLIMGPGLRLMSENEDKYAPMAELADVWMIQTQRFQINTPGPEYRQQVEKIVQQIRTENQDIVIWAQITLPPDREPNADEWLAYRDAIVDIVDGTYIGIYTWDTVDNELLTVVIDRIFTDVCGELS